MNLPNDLGKLDEVDIKKAIIKLQEELDFRLNYKLYKKCLRIEFGKYYIDFKNDKREIDSFGLLNEDKPCTPNDVINIANYLKRIEIHEQREYRKGGYCG